MADDLDVLDVVTEMRRLHQAPCGHWDWDADLLEPMYLDHSVCLVCQHIYRYRDDVAEQRRDMYGVYFAHYPTPRDEESLNGN